MGAYRQTSRFSQVHVSLVRQPGGAIGVGIVCRTRNGVNVVKLAYVSSRLTAGEALYEGVLTALEEAAHNGVRGLTVYLDSPQAVNELNRRSPVAPALQPLYIQVRCQANALGRVRFELAGRHQNFAARRLARAALVGRKPIHIEYDNALLPLRIPEEAAA